MPQSHPKGAEPPAKRSKLEMKGGYKFTSADEIRKMLRTHDQASLTEGAQVIANNVRLYPHEFITALTALRNQLAVQADEVISSQDERVLLSQNWMELSPGAQDIFEAWEGSNQVCRRNTYFLVRTLITAMMITEAIISLGTLCRGVSLSLRLVVLPLYVPFLRVTDHKNALITSMDAPIELQSLWLA
jgi:hypothetical protein